jgi:predicted dehydrogenase
MLGIGIISAGRASVLHAKAAAAVAETQLVAIMGIAFLEFASGVCATLMHAGYRDGVNRFEAEITGTEDQLRIDGDRGGGRSLWRSRKGEGEEIVVLAEEPPIEIGMSRPVFEAQMQEFARSILEVRPPAITAEYGRRVVRVLEACVESSRTEREVRFSYIASPRIRGEG